MRPYFRSAVELAERHRVALAVDAEYGTPVDRRIAIPALPGRKADAARDVGLPLVHQDPGRARPRLRRELELDLTDVRGERPIGDRDGHHFAGFKGSARERAQRAVVEAGRQEQKSEKRDPGRDDAQEPPEHGHTRLLSARRRSL
jgi:hypothetical protein